jgi:2-polyprenyl-3-methyl-5-hydroxy-6-metoxy-1,4-benzoquinol methylase
MTDEQRFTAEKNSNGQPGGPGLHVSESYREAFRRILLDTYFSGWDPTYLASNAGLADIENHVYARMSEVETVVMPWIGEVHDVTEKSVLEIGCGTGSTTIPFAIKAKYVYATDISQTSLTAAKQRAELLEVSNIDFQLLDPEWAQDSQRLQDFESTVPKVDIIVMMALLEHLTISERINVLRTTWRLLKPHGIMVIYETPNRLSWFDWHSFLLPFFQYLPDQLAIEYADKTPRPHFQLQGNKTESLYRLGRGVSYHEFELALGLNELSVINDGFSKHLQHRKNLGHDTFDWAIQEIFDQYLPYVPRGFVLPSLDLIIQKDAAHLARAPSLPAQRQPLISIHMLDLNTISGRVLARALLRRIRQKIRHAL